jgi:hypothetical protein
MFCGAEQVTPRADSDEEIGIRYPRLFIKKQGEDGVQAWAGCRKPGSEAEAGARGVGAG